VIAGPRFGIARGHHACIGLDDLGPLVVTLGRLAKQQRDDFAGEPAFFTDDGGAAERQINGLSVLDDRPPFLVGEHDRHFPLGGVTLGSPAIAFLFHVADFVVFMGCNVFET
jgi:hypothetical protein